MNLRSSNGVQDLERDPLTGLYTRASANRIVKIGIEEAQGDEGVISVALLDIDRFEHFDEEHGLSAGDALLKSVSEIILAAETGAEAISRYSRDTFLLSSPAGAPRTPFSQPRRSAPSSTPTPLFSATRMNPWRSRSP